MRPNFADCGKEFVAHSHDIYSQYLFNGTVQGIISADPPPLLTREGCKKLCGTGTQYYEWHVNEHVRPGTWFADSIKRKDAANTITTWVLPIIGLIIQAPWESNQAWETTQAFFRYLGSPISVLSYVLWNIKVTGKAALMVDMSTKYSEYPPEGSEFAIMRDSMYILCVMNQCKHPPFSIQQTRTFHCSVSNVSI